MPVTLKDIADRLGVTRQTVAKAMGQNKGRVSDKLKSEIQRVASEMNYVPNFAAQRLKGVSTRTIGIYRSPDEYALGQVFLSNLQQSFSKLGYSIVTCYSYDEASHMQVRRLLSQGVDGWLDLECSELSLQLDNLNMPKVRCPYAPADGFDFAVDHAAGTYEAMKMMLKCGRRRPLFLKTYGDDDDDSILNKPSQMKLEGIRQAMEEAGEPMPVLELCISDKQKNGLLVVRELIRLKPDVIFCCNDYFAARIVSLLIDAGVSVPEDIAVIGYDGLSLCDFCRVPLATIIQPMKLMAQKASELLVKHIESRNCNAAPARTLLKPFFYPSTSCGMENARLNDLPIYNSFMHLEAVLERTRL